MEARLSGGVIRFGVSCTVHLDEALPSRKGYSPHCSLVLLPWLYRWDIQTVQPTDLLSQFWEDKSGTPATHTESH